MNSRKTRFTLATFTAALILGLGFTNSSRVLSASEWSEEAVLRLAEAPGGPSRAAIEAGLAAYRRAVDRGAVANQRFLTLIDYTLPSVKPRLWVLDVMSGAIAHRELVAHGRGSGDNVATSFSNVEGSHKSSLGLFVTDDSYVGQNGYSLRLRGLDAGLNDQAYARAIVIHGAAYVSETIARQLGRLGRSLGCPALRPEVARTIIDTIKGGSVVFAYGPATSARRR